MCSKRLCLGTDSKNNHGQQKNVLKSTSSYLVYLICQYHFTKKIIIITF